MEKLLSEKAESWKSWRNLEFEGERPAVWAVYLIVRQDLIEEARKLARMRMEIVQQAHVVDDLQETKFSLEKQLVDIIKVGEGKQAPVTREEHLESLRKKMDKLSIEQLDKLSADVELQELEEEKE